MRKKYSKILKNTQKYSKILGVILLFLENFPASAPVFVHEIYISVANTKQKEHNINTRKWKSRNIKQGERKAGKVLVVFWKPKYMERAKV